MKKLLSTVKILVPSFAILWMIFALRGGTDILAGLFIFFPILHIAMGAVDKSLPFELFPSMVLANLAFLLPINLLFNMTDCIEFAVAYDLLTLLSFWMKKKILCAIDKKSH
jgi:hypothetical protein